MTQLTPNIRAQQPVRYTAFEFANQGKVVQLDDSDDITPGCDVLMVHSTQASQ